ncbi:MAG: hypothetical protein ACE5EI_04995 [Thermodesulfobacteriota bacterium]
MDKRSTGDDIYFTESMAEVLEKQGHLDDALMMYKILADNSPRNEALRRKVASLRELAGKRRARRTRAEAAPGGVK